MRIFEVFDDAFLWQYEVDSETIEKVQFCTHCCLPLDAPLRFGNGELKHLEEELQKQLDAHPDDMSCYVCQSDTLIQRFGVTWWFGRFTKCRDAFKCWCNADIILLYVYIIYINLYMYIIYTYTWMYVYQLINMFKPQGSPWWYY